MFLHYCKHKQRPQIGNGGREYGWRFGNGEGWQPSRNELKKLSEGTRQSGSWI